MLDWLFDADTPTVVPVALILICGTAEVGRRLGLRHGETRGDNSDVGTLTGASLGIVGLLLGFSFSMSLSHFDQRRAMVLEEANAIGSTANFALMLPQPYQAPALRLLRDYTQLRIGLSRPYDPRKFDADVARSVDLQGQLWQQAVAMVAATPVDSLAVHRYVASLNEVNNVHQRRIQGLRIHLPVTIVVAMVTSGMVGMGFAGYYAGLAGGRRFVTMLLMSAMLVALILMVIDLDEPNRGMIRVSVQSLIDALNGLPK